MTVYQFKFLGRKYYYRCNSPEECRKWATNFLKIPPYAIQGIKEANDDMLWVKDYHIQTDEEIRAEIWPIVGILAILTVIVSLLGFLCAEALS